MLEKGSLKYVMHFLLSLVIVFIATWLYYYDSPTMVFGGIIFWLYFKALRDSQKIKNLQNSLNDLQKSQKS